MSSPEEKAYEIMRELDVNYVLVIFGGLTGYSSDGKNLNPKGIFGQHVEPNMSQFTNGKYYINQEEHSGLDVKF